MDHRNLGDIEGEEKGLNLKVKLINAEKRTAKTERGENVYFYGLMGDETGTMFFTAWAFNPNVQAGDVLELKNCYTKEFNGTLRLYMDNRSEIILLPEEDLEVKRSFKEVRIRELTAKDTYVTVRGVLSEIRSRDFERDGNKTVIYYGDLEDDTGRIRISSFGKQLPEDKGVKIEGAKVSEYKGRLRLSINDKTDVTEEEIAKPPERRFYNVADLENPVGGVSFTGFIISVGEKSGLRIRCSECRKTIEDLRCPDHPDKPFVYDLFAYFTLSDGTGYVQCTAGRVPLMKLIGMEEEQLDPSKSTLTKRDVYTRIHEALHGKPFLVEGDLVEGNMGLSLRINSLRGVSADDLKTMTRMMEAEL